MKKQYNAVKPDEVSPFKQLFLFKSNSFLFFRDSIASLVKSKLTLAFLLICLINLPLYAQTPPAGFSSVAVSSGWDGAVGLTFSKDGKLMFVWEKGGKVWVVKNGVKTLVLDISPEVGNWHDHGMLGFALHPNFDVNGYFYVSYVVERHYMQYYGTPSYDPTVTLDFKATFGRMTRYTAVKNESGNYVANLASRKILLGETRSTGIPIVSKSHGVGSLVFGTDGTLLMSTGDGASPSAADGGGPVNGSYSTQAKADGIITAKEDIGAFRSQSLESLSGKILRLDPETGAGIASNPFYQAASPKSVRSRIWALGLRNPFRVTLKPGTGSIDQALGNPGVLYVGDVGFLQWEELNVITKAGMNFGWPLYEGLQLNTAIYEFPAYNSLNVANPYAPNPLYGVNGCTQQYFRFKDLLQQVTFGGTNTFNNPCNNTQPIPANINRFVHSRPIIDWKHGTVGPSRTGIFSGETAAVVDIGAAVSPVKGSQFGGNAAIAGVFYTGIDFPVEYRSALFFGDYANGWIRNIRMDVNDKPKEVKDFINTGATVVFMSTHPTEKGIYYIHYTQNGAEIRRFVYGSVKQPVAVASANKYYGNGPLTVQFTGSNSSDPDNLALTYEWDFGDGTPKSTTANPSHVYAKGAGAPVKYNVTLKVTNSNNVSTTNTSLFVSVNNTPPVVNITSPVHNALYQVDEETLYTLKATVTDAQHSGAGLSYQWQTVQHHEDHTHPGPVDTNVETTSLLIPEASCDGETYWFVVTLKVTDAAGLAAIDSVTLYPDCNGMPTNITNLAAVPGKSKITLSWTNSSSYDEMLVVVKAGAPITASPTGNGSAYIANLNFSGAGSSFDGGKVVYKGTVSPQIITSLINDYTYFIKVFTRKGTNWSTGVEIFSSPYNPTSQTITAQWNKRFGGAGGEGFTTAIQTSDGGYLVGGHSPSVISGDKTEASRGGMDFWAVKVNSAGIKQWDKRFGGTADDYMNVIVQTPDGGYLLGGNSASGIGGDKTEASYGDRDYWLVKINSAGIKQWDKRYGSNGFEDIRCIIPTSDGGYMLGGHSASAIGPDKTEDNRGEIDYWLVKINNAGVRQWDKRFGGSAKDDFQSVIQTTDGGYLVAGSSLSTVGGDKTEASRGGVDYWVVKVNSAGIKEWDKRFGGSGDDDLFKAVQTSDGGYVLAGRSNSPLDGDKTVVNLGSFDYWILKISSTGGKILQKRFGGSGSDDLRAMTKTTDGGYLLAGSSESGISGHKTQASRGSFDYWIFKLNGSFAKEWDKRFGGTASDELRSVIQTSDGSYLLGGRSNSGIGGDKTEDGRGSTDYWIVKVSAVNGVPAMAESGNRINAETDTTQIILSANPNPFTDKITVGFSLLQTEQVQLKVYNEFGLPIATLYKGEAQAGKPYIIEWQAEKQKAGIYIIRLGTSSKVSHKKIILIR